MAIDPENKSSENLARLANAAQKAGIADETAAYEAAIKASGTATDPATSHAGGDVEAEENEAHSS